MAVPKGGQNRDFLEKAPGIVRVRRENALNDNKLYDTIDETVICAH